ncbi:MAG TPA: zf-HC2 domain-containing protein [Candidatus Acidoferrales bacterium]|nr:zf-HC2 domain-containing protein [Candidatus Acidoferrales bacterium]
MTCKELVDLITDYLEGALPAADRLRFEQHLDLCPPCRTYVEQIRQTIRVAGELNEESLSEDAKALLLRLFNDWKRN